MEVLTREAFLHTDFIGNNYSFGLGLGNGDGSGYDNGSGCGSSFIPDSISYNGYGRGYSCGYGYDYVAGDGYGIGFSDGRGYGCAYGVNSNYKIKTLNGQMVDMIDGISTILTKITGNVAKGFIIRPDFSLVPTFVCKQDNIFAHGETLHKAREALLEKLFNNMPTKERIEAFCAEFKPRVKRPVMDFFSWHHRLTGSCEKGRREFARQYNIDIDHDEITPEEFFALTCDSYGSDIIRQTEKTFTRQYETGLMD